MMGCRVPGLQYTGTECIMILNISIMEEFVTNYYDKEGNRKEPYAQDSTKGKSGIDPLNYKGDVLTQAWMDSRVLASFAVWLEKHGFYSKSLSDVSRRPLEVLFEHLIEIGDMVPIEDTNTARDELQRRFRVSLNRGGRGLKNTVHNQVLSTKRQDLGAKVAQGQAFNDAQRPDSTTRKQVNSEEIRRLTEIHNRIESQTVEQAVALGLASGAVIKEGMTDEELAEHIAMLDRDRIERENDPTTLEFLKSQVVKDDN
jgi:hypothetical protein